ncbi:hypothetical protein RCH14_000620 [Massilia sp. MP_M2]|uniref:hypothetical protein n=1 Tax=Massilia sp. MP_M2 TaxID=3071713 RepID=UPI00319EA288
MRTPALYGSLLMGLSFSTLAAGGVRTDLSTLGQGDQYKPYYDRNPDARGWTYSLDDFTRLGVRDIKVINPPWKPGSASGQTPVVTIPIDVKPAPAS